MMTLPILKIFSVLNLSRLLWIVVIATNAGNAALKDKAMQNSKAFNSVIVVGVPVGGGAKNVRRNNGNLSGILSKAPQKTSLKIPLKPTAKKPLKRLVRVVPNKTKNITTIMKKIATPVAAVQVKSAPPFAMAMAMGTGLKTLILYDYRPENVYGKLGKAYAIMLSNLLGHFNAEITLLPVNDYVAGSVNNYDATFYLGSYFGNIVSPAFLQDAKTTANTVVWFKYNLDQLTQWGDQNGAFAQQFGFYFNGLQGLNSAPTAAMPAPGFYDTVLYKDRSFVKYYDYHPVTNTVFADYDAGQTTISNAALAKPLVTIQNTKTGAVMPYVIRANHFWYFADSPFSYIGPRDRYLVFADILHDILAVDHAEQHRAMIRLEDISAMADPASLYTLSDYLSQQNIAFSMAVIPHYLDPFGYFNAGTRIEIPFSQATNLKSALDYALGKGGAVVQHGYTHQYLNNKNPNTGVSGDDFEFWNLADKDGDPATFDPVNAPIPDETAESVLGQIDAGINELSSAGYAPFAWETPHYQASPVAYRAIAQRYPVAYERAVYYTGEAPDLNPTNPSRDIVIGQFFPYVIEKDYYGRKVLPENLGNIQSTICPSHILFCTLYSWQDLSLNADYALTVRDGFASFFFHPFLLTKAQNENNANYFEDLQKLINSITALHFQWIGANSLAHE
jgi:uncharacterized protein YdaL